MAEPSPGFTLLEMLVVLAFMGLLSAFVLPSLTASYASTRNRMALSDIAEQVAALGLRAQHSQQELRLGGDSEGVPTDLLDLPAGWQVSADEPVVYLATGACLGGRLQVSGAGQTWVLQLAAPYCQPRLEARQ